MIIERNSRAATGVGTLGFAVVLLMTCLLLFSCAPDEPAEAEKKEKAEARCTMCGMDTSISKGRFLIDFQDGTTIDACCGRCAASLTRKQSSPIYKVRAYAYDTGALIDGKEASYVFGADIIPEGSMAPPVFAFSTEEAARAFIGEHGGRLATLDDVLALTPPSMGHGAHPKPQGGGRH
jgi:nitrous oxide reductase accessory protein NosL